MNKPFRQFDTYYYVGVIGDRSDRTITCEILDGYFQHENKPYGRREGWRVLVRITSDLRGLQKPELEKYLDELIKL